MTWFLVFNTTNPTASRTIEIPLKILNSHSPTSLGLSERDATVPDNITVKVSGRSDIIGNLSISDLNAVVDFSDVKKAGNTQLEIKEPECSRLGIKIVDYYPKSVDVEFDNVSQKNIDVIVDYDDTLLADGFEFLSVVSEPESIQISGFASDIEEIDFIKVFLKDSLSEKSIDSDKIGSFLGHYILKSGEDATAEYDSEKITVKIEVAKRVPVKYTLVGEPHSDYYVASNSVSEKTVLIRGSSMALRNIKEIDLGEISIENSQESFNKTINLQEYLPADVKAYQINTVDVNVEILKYETRSFTVRLDEISMTGKKDEYEYEFKPESFEISVKGKPTDLDNLSATSLGATINLEDAEGTYVQNLSFEGIDEEKYSIIGEYRCDVKITKKQNEEMEDNVDNNVNVVAHVGENSSEQNLLINE